MGGPAEWSWPVIIVMALTAASGLNPAFGQRCFKYLGSGRQHQPTVTRKFHPTMTAVRRRRVEVPVEVPVARPLAPLATGPATIKVAQTFYRRTGNLLLNCQLPFSSSLDGEIWALFLPALLALMLEPVQASRTAALWSSFFICCYVYLPN